MILDIKIVFAGYWNQQILSTNIYIYIYIGPYMSPAARWIAITSFRL